MESFPFSTWFLLHRTSIFYCLILLGIFIIGQQSYRNSIMYSSTVDINRFLFQNSTRTHPFSWFIAQRDNSQIMSLYYRHATSARNSSYPFISGDTFRAFADHIFDETKQTNLDSLTYGDSIFIKPDRFGHFFGNLFHSIKTPFVLITHNSDFGAPSQYKIHLENSKVLAWFASNPDTHHKKLFPIPIGMANTRWYSGDINKLTDAFLNHRRPWSNRTTLLYVNFAVATNRGPREKARAQASKIKGAHIVKERISFDTYLQQVGNTKFVLSPPGNGLDCHRTWEALLMGAAPIVLSSELDPLFGQLPSVILSNWSQLTEDLLLSYNFSSYDTLVPDVLSARYWREKLLIYRNTTRKSGE